MTDFEHQETDVTMTIRFRKDIYEILEANMKNRKPNTSNKKTKRTPTWNENMPTKSIHTTLDTILRTALKNEL